MLEEIFQVRVSPPRKKKITMVSWRPPDPGSYISSTHMALQKAAPEKRDGVIWYEARMER
ncbi:OLC1v1036120C1 [Oldenlandia corymbosa var. corymbosa]|uniref:OLC1v1036120C1 n=1 Tax=Oldenlandia corymbosa var. corymbosa TaxID=529605 RepID=A0AAV1CX56_OLDCO|nr:OLC1v1036120C1 [Oldenlandia corymbosa var. corymbosa]